ncbi:MAG TPA: type II secretion system F family protein [Pirellulales bacterium]|jgi:tight adherence protein B|nr:type II secretion system F family protein [Pirellulales bacterium]
MNPLLITIAVFVAVSLLVAIVAMWFHGGVETKVEDRLAQLTGAKVAGGGKDGLLKESGVLTQPLDATQGMLEEFLARFRGFSLWFEQANVTITASRFFGICGALAAVAVVGGFVMRLNPAVLPLLGLGAGMMPLMWLKFRRSRRFSKFAKQLPDSLELISRALRAGHSLQAGFHLVAEETSDPIATEFRRVYEEQNLGIPLDEALRNMNERMPNVDLRFFVTAVILQRQTGGDLAQILDKIGQLIRQRFEIFGQVQALTGEGRLSGIVLLALPPALFLAVYNLNPDYVMPLFTDPLGKQMMAGGVLLQLFGALVIRKIVNIEV